MIQALLYLLVFISGIFSMYGIAYVSIYRARKSKWNGEIFLENVKEILPDNDKLHMQIIQIGNTVGEPYLIIEKIIPQHPDFSPLFIKKSSTIEINILTGNYLSDFVDDKYPFKKNSVRIKIPSSDYRQSFLLMKPFIKEIKLWDDDYEKEHRELVKLIERYKKRLENE